MKLIEKMREMKREEKGAKGAAEREATFEEMDQAMLDFTREQQDLKHT